MNRENFKAVLDVIENDPEHWSQAYWHSRSKSSHCFAGWAQILSGRVGRYVRNDAIHWLELDLIEAVWLFARDRTIEDFRKFYEHQEIPPEDLFKLRIFDKELAEAIRVTREVSKRQHYSGRCDCDRDEWAQKVFRVN